MRIGIDIDDVLYRTSLMIRTKAPSVLRSMNLPDTIDENKYHLRDRCRINEEQYTKINAKLNWISLEYINATAVQALKALKQANSSIEYCVVTWRPEKDTLPILQLLRQYFYFDIDHWYCLPEGLSKADFCENNSIDILLDDNTDVVQGFDNKTTCGAILVSTEEIIHNKMFAVDYPFVLTEWIDLYRLIEEAMNRKDGIA